MLGVQGKLLKKLKTIKTIGYLKPERVLRANDESDSYSNSGRCPLMPIQEDPCKENIFHPQEPEIIDLKEQTNQSSDSEKENIWPEMEDFEEREDNVTLSEVDVSKFRRPDLNSRTLFDPKLLAAFKQAVEEYNALLAEKMAKEFVEDESEDQEPPLKARKVDPLLDFEDKCPPGGRDSIILYTTALRGIRKTFDDCQKMRSLLEKLRVLFFERDVSMHSEYKEELWRVLGGKIVPPRLFIKGRYIGGADEVLGLHERGKFKPLIEGIPIDDRDGPCEGCAGFRFIICFECNGSRKIAVEEEDGGGVDVHCCLECNENGVMICPLCCLNVLNGESVN